MGPADADEIAPRTGRERRGRVLAAARCPKACASTSSSTPEWAATGSPSCRTPTRDVVGLMSHLATADTDPAFAREQVARFDELVSPYRGTLECHIANSAAALRLPEARFDAARCGDRDLRALAVRRRSRRPTASSRCCSWRSRLAQVKLLQPGESTGYGRRFVAERPTWIGLVPVGYADGFRRDLTGTDVRVDGEPAEVVGTDLDGLVRRASSPRELPAGTPVTLIGDGVARRGAREGRRHDQLRDRDRHQLRSATRERARWSSA